MNKKIFYFAAFILAVIGFLCAIEGILLPFVLAFVLAYLLNPLVNRLAKCMGRSIATILVVVMVVVVIALGLFLLIPVLQTQISGFIGRIPLMAEKLWSYLKEVILISFLMDYMVYLVLMPLKYSIKYLVYQWKI